MNKTICLLALLFVCAILSGTAYNLEILYQSDSGSQGILATNHNQICFVTSDSLIFWDLDAKGRSSRSNSVGKPSEYWSLDAVLTARGDVWLSTEAGLKKYSAKGWENYPVFDNRFIAISDTGELWSAGYSLQKFNGLDFDQVVSDRDWQTRAFGVNCFEIDRSGNPWIGIMGSAIIRFNGQKLDNWLGQPSGPDRGGPGGEDAAPQAICFDRNNNLWVDYPLGVARWIDKSWQEFDLIGRGLEYGATALAVDNQGILWVSDGGQGLVCFDGAEWFEPQFTGSDIFQNAQTNLHVRAMLPGPANSMMFVLTSEAADMQGLFVCRAVQSQQPERSSENSPTYNRSYPPPSQSDYLTEIGRLGQNLKGPVKSVYGNQMYLPTYFSYQEFYPDGKIKTSTSGRTSVNSETKYWYDEHGNLSKEQYTDRVNGEELDYSQTLYEYEYDSLGYPVIMSEKNLQGVTLKNVKYVYADTTYYKEWQIDPDEYSPGYAYRDTFDSKGRIVLSTVTNLGDSSVAMNKFAYIPNRNTTIEEYEWSGSRFNKKRVTVHDRLGVEKEWTIYDFSGKIQTKQTFTLDGNNNLLASDFYDRDSDTTSHITYKYTFDRYGNPLSIISTVDGEVDYEQSSTITYEYY